MPRKALTALPALLIALALATGPLGGSGCAGSSAEKEISLEAWKPIQPRSSTKPEASKEVVEAAKPKLQAYLARVLKGKKVGGTPIESVELVHARLFDEGRINETWYLAISIDGSVNHAALKIFGDAAGGEASYAKIRAAQKAAWPQPREIVWDTTEPYSERKSLLMEFIIGGSLQSRLKRLYSNDKVPWDDEVGGLYGEVAAALGRVHKGRTRARKAGDRSGVAAMGAMIERCAKEGWCDDAAQVRWKALTEGLDDGPVAFVHGDLDESQIIFTPNGKFAVFLDFDESGYGDAATDVGALLCHVLLLNPTMRSQVWAIPDAPTGETKASARAILASYRAKSGVAEEDWGPFLKRVQAHMWIRFGDVMVKYRGNKHAEFRVEALDEQVREIVAKAPFKEWELN
jgi:aminoglycoside phosphotransferase (APT) family kinase protein